MTISLEFGELPTERLSESLEAVDEKTTEDDGYKSHVLVCHW